MGIVAHRWLESIIACLQDSTTSSAVCIQVMQLSIIGCELQQEDHVNYQVMPCKPCNQLAQTAGKHFVCSTLLLVACSSLSANWFAATSGLYAFQKSSSLIHVSC